MAGPEALLHSLELEFDRHFAAKQLGTDAFGCAVGAAVYVALAPHLLGLGRADLAAAALVCALLSLWPQALTRLGQRDIHLMYRDHLLLLHHTFHYAIGGQFARVVRLQSKMVNPGPTAFLLGFALSSSMPWQVLDSLLLRMRWRRFVAFKLVILLSVAGLDWRVCQVTCAALPEQSAIFSAGARMMRALASLCSPMSLSHPAQQAAPGEGVEVSCFKLQEFSMLVLAWVLPAVLLRRLEQQAWHSFLAARRAGALDARAAPLLQQGSKPAALRALLPAIIAMPALAMHASGAGAAMSLAAAGAAALALAGAPLPRPLAAPPAAPSAAALPADWRALEEAAAAHLAWWPGVPGWLAVALLLTTCWHVIDLFQGSL